MPAIKKYDSDHQRSHGKHPAPKRLSRAARALRLRISGDFSCLPCQLRCRFRRSDSGRAGQAVKGGVHFAAWACDAHPVLRRRPSRASQSIRRLEAPKPRPRSSVPSIHAHRCGGKRPSDQHRRRESHRVLACDPYLSTIRSGRTSAAPPCLLLSWPIRIRRRSIQGNTSTGASTTTRTPTAETAPARMSAPSGNNAPPSSTQPAK